MINLDELSLKTVMEIKSFAKKNNIDLQGATKKIQILEIIKAWTPPEIQEKTDETDQYDKVAVYSQKNIFWNGVGELKKGYNIVSREESEKWITHQAVRIATPSEVASYYGKTQ